MMHHSFRRCWTRLATVAHVMVFELFDVRGIDGLAYDFVDNERIDGSCFQNSWHVRLCRPMIDAQFVSVVVFVRPVATIGGVGR